MSLNIPQFVDFLSNGNTSIPIEANFKITIDNLFENIITKLKNVENTISPTEGILKIINTKDIWVEGQYKTQETILFANGVTVPGESSTIARVGPNGDGLHGGLLTAPILKGRKDLTNLEITFLETNVSFIDTIIRPWSVAVAQYGLFARAAESPQNFKTTVTVNYLNKVNNKIRKQITFKDAAPVEVQGYETAYGSGGKGTEVRFAKTTWVYSTYSISYPAFEATPTT